MSYSQTVSEFQNSVNDDFCLQSANNAELLKLLNDGEDYVFNKVDEKQELEKQKKNDQEKPNVSDIRHLEKTSNESKWSVAVKQRIQNVYNDKIFAKPYLEDQFYSFEKWPPYMVELFILNNISSYSYSLRNKICLFFFGNGAKFEVMFTLIAFFAPTDNISSSEYKSSYQKCVGLFKTYESEKYNPAYSSRYYYYNMIENRMLYLDGVQRHYGLRHSEQ